MRALHIPPRPETVFGPGSVATLPDHVRRLGDAAFVVTDPGLVAAGVAGPVVDSLARADLRVELFEGVTPNPAVDAVEAGASVLRAFGPATVVALGGGSPIDAAKAIALRAVNARPLRALDYRAQPDIPAGPLVAVPTTAGTGTETNAFGVITDAGHARKLYVGHASALPRLALLDPALSVGLPPRATAACGIDVLAHAVESLQARAGNPYAASLALEAARIVVHALPRAVADGADLDARARMLLAAHLAGLAFAATGLGTAHAIGHALSNRYGTAHGVALAAILPLVAGQNLPERPAASARLAGALGVTEGGADAVPDAIAELQARVGLRPALRELAVAREELGLLADEALADVVIGNAPRRPGREELVRLLERAW